MRWLFERRQTRVEVRLRGLGAFLAVVTALASPSSTAAQLPFDLTPEDLLQADTAGLRWVGLRTYVGGAEGSLAYDAQTVELALCRAVAVVGLARMRVHYRAVRESEPVTLRLAVRCGLSYRAGLEYDGVMLRLEVRELTSGELVYQARRRGLP